MTLPSDPMKWTDDELDAVIRDALPQLDVVTFMRVVNGELPEQDVTDLSNADEGSSELSPVRSLNRGWGGEGGGGRGRPIRIALVGVAAALIALGVYVVTSSNSTGNVSVIGAGVESPASTGVVTPSTMTSPPGSTSTVEHLTKVDDRSLALQSSLGDPTDAVKALIQESPLRRSLSLAEYFPSTGFPVLSPLPARTTWTFVNPKVQTPDSPCHSFVPAPITMTGFAGQGWLSDTTNVTTVTYTFTGPAEATDFLKGRSLQLGVLGSDCIADASGGIEVEHQAMELTPVPANIDQWHSWTFSAPDLIIDETGAYGYVLRRGDQIFEIRVGVKKGRTFTPAELSSFVGVIAGS